MRYAEYTPSLTGQWPGFRGSDLRNIARPIGNIDFSADFPVQWIIETGEGHAAPAIYNGRVYLLDYDEKLSSDALRCFSLETGVELWRRWYRVPMKRNHGFSRTVPAVTDKYVITFGPQAHVMCCDPVTGELKWTFDVKKHFETDVPPWYAGQCPLIDGDQLIIAPAGKDVLMAGIDCETGEILWQTPNTLGYKMSHSSVMPMTLGGKKTYVYMAVGGVVGVSGEAADKGELLWNVNWPPSVVAPSALQLSGSEVALTAGYGAGGALLSVKNSDGRWTANMDRYRPNEGMSSEQQTPILYDQMVITVMPKDGGGLRGKLVAYSPTDLRVPLWESAADERFGLGPYLMVGDHLFVLKDDGELFVYKPERRRATLIKKQRIMDGIDAWGPMAYADGYLILRDSYRVYCLRID
ncbi:MAG: PQQ-binding-like beta-propeller repeat protein [Rikenellaceae bacterium]|nr:PQQ-binding-like beta-propeller repeat protein [Rikenellaceae bacterium]MCL2692724.1 PQQ-binding-like beta-propeller repeat protein [Rikenellaceae bacterium]